MSKKIKVTLSRRFSILVIAVISISFTTNDLIDRLIHGLEINRKENFQEKVYLHIDNSYYIAGEEINYKGYLTNAYNTDLRGGSKVLYTELYDPNNILIAKHTSTIKKGQSPGNIPLVDTLLSGSYTIVSYTNWMKNSDEDYYFRKNIQIYNSDNTSNAEKINTKNIDIQFFPEGGELVNGLTSKVAFKAVNNLGVGIKVSGEIYNNYGDKIADIVSNNLGMGAFVIKPIQGEEYHVKLKNIEVNKAYKLPSQLTQGLVMSVNNFGKEYIRVNIQGKGITNKNILIVLQNRGEIHYYVKAEVSSKGITTKIPKGKLPPGISQITVFDLKTQLPIMERLIFIQEEKQLQIHTISKRVEYGTREKVNAKITVHDAKGLPIIGDFSLSVTNRSKKKYSDDIHSFILLTSELKGKIENPNYYFQETTPNTVRDLDYLMLTQGWRRFTWENILETKPKANKFDIELGGLFSIKNRLLSNGELVKNEDISILLINQLAPYQSRTNEKGQLDFKVIDFFGDETYIYQITKNKNIDIDIDNSYKNSNTLPQNNIFNSKVEKDTKRSIENYLINTAYKSDAKSSEKPITNIYSKNNYSMLYDKSINLKEYISFPNMTEVFKEIVAGVSVHENQIKIYSKDLSKTYQFEPLYIVNGIPTFDTEYILGLETSVIESIGIIHSPKALTRFGEIGKNGVLVFNVSGKVDKTNDTNIIKNLGFISPKNSTPQSTKLKKQRRILFPIFGRYCTGIQMSLLIKTVKRQSNFIPPMRYPIII